MFPHPPSTLGLVLLFLLSDWTEGVSSDWEIDYTNPTTIGTSFEDAQGHWQNVQHCPPGSVVTGFNVKYVPYRGSAGSTDNVIRSIFTLGLATWVQKAENYFDDYGVVAIWLGCRDIRTNVVTTMISSDYFTFQQLQDLNPSSGCHEKWMQFNTDENLLITCPRKEPAIGFRLRVEPTATCDDCFGAINFKLVCPGQGGKLADPYIHYDTVTKPIWSPEIMCPEGKVVCGIQTKTHRVVHTEDSAGLTDVRLECCKMERRSLPLNCEPVETFQRISRVQNCHQDPMIHTVRLLKATEGSTRDTRTNERTNGGSTWTTFGVEIDAETKFKGIGAKLLTKFEQKFGSQWTQRYAHEFSNIDLLRQETEETFQVSVPPGHEGLVDQLILSCGTSVVVRTKFLKFHSEPKKPGKCW